MQSFKTIVRLWTFFFISIHLPSAEGQTMRALLLDEFIQHPASQIQDLYKFAYQAAMGNAHFVKDSSSLQSLVLKELSDTDTTNAGPLITYIAPEKRIARIHLRAARKAGISAERLYRAILETARTIHPSVPLLHSYLVELEKLADDALLPFSYEQVHAFILKMEQSGFPPVHHSQQYNEAYQPAYYIISGDCVRTYMSGKKP